MTEDTNVGRRHPAPLVRGSLSRLGREGKLLEDFLRHLLDSFTGKPVAHASQHEPGGDDAIATNTGQQILAARMFGVRPEPERPVNDAQQLRAVQMLARTPPQQPERPINDAAAILAQRFFGD